MNTATASAKTFGKYLFWTVIAAGIQAVSQQIPNMHLPEWSIPLIGAALKAAATAVQTELDKKKSDA